MKRITVGLGREFDRHGRAISPELAADLKKLMIDEAVRVFGGATVIDTQGAWRDQHGKVVAEKGYTVLILVDGSGDAFVKGREFANYVVGLFSQQSVVFTVEDVQGFFVNAMV